MSSRSGWFEHSAKNRRRRHQGKYYGLENYEFKSFVIISSSNYPHFQNYSSGVPKTQVLGDITIKNGNLILLTNYLDQGIAKFNALSSFEKKLVNSYDI